MAIKKGYSNHWSLVNYPQPKQKRITFSQLYML